MSEQLSLLADEKHYIVPIWRPENGMRFFLHQWRSTEELYMAHVGFQSELTDDEYSILSESQIEEIKRRFPKNAAIIDAAKIEVDYEEEV